MLLDMTPGERQNQANETRAQSGTEAYTGSFGTVTQYTVCRTGQGAGATVTPTHVLRSGGRRAFLLLSGSSHPHCPLICDAQLSG